MASSIAILLLSARPATAQDGYACGYGKTPREAIADIANGYVLVSTHTRYHTGSGDEYPDEKTNDAKDVLHIAIRNQAGPHGNVFRGEAP